MTAIFFFSSFFLFFFLSFFSFFFAPNSEITNFILRKLWSFLLSWYDYYELFWIKHTTELNLLREIYFLWSSFFFFLINFMLIYGLIAAILLSFLIKKFYIFLAFTQIKSLKITNQLTASFFIRNQNFIKQQGMTAGTKVWLKKKQLTYAF